MSALVKAASYYKQYGIREFGRKAWQELKSRGRARIRATKVGAVAAELRNIPLPSVAELMPVQERLSSPIRTYSKARPHRYLNLVTDSVNSGSLYGGVGTAIVFAAILARHKGLRLRVVTRRERAHSDNVTLILRVAGVQYDDNIEFRYLPCMTDDPEYLDVDPGDLFVTTSWWTTASVLTATAPDRIVYLIQEDERMFYPVGDDFVRCSYLLQSSDINFVVNSRILLEHFSTSGLQNIAENGLYFEPAFPDTLFYQDSAARAVEKKRLFFYARPEHDRNLFRTGLESLNRAVTDGVVDTDTWDVYVVGPGVPNFKFDNGYEPTVIRTLQWDAYAELIRSIDVGISLMASPHPSYPPLDLAASGAVVVTNSHGLKVSLACYSSNILVVPPKVESLVAGLSDAIALSLDVDVVASNYRNSAIVRSWEETFGSVVERI